MGEDFLFLSGMTLGLCAGWVLGWSVHEKVMRIAAKHLQEKYPAFKSACKDLVGE